MDIGLNFLLDGEGLDCLVREVVSDQSELQLLSTLDEAVEEAQLVPFGVEFLLLFLVKLLLDKLRKSLKNGQKVKKF